MRMKILICFPASLQLGGVERSLIGLLDALGERNDCDVDVFIYGHHGDLFPYVNHKVHLLPEVNELAYLQEAFIAKLQHRCFYAAWQRLLCQLKGLDYFEMAYRVCKKKAPILEKTYDIAIGFFLPFDFIVHNVKAKKKFGWIHTDYTRSHPNLAALKKQYEKMDYIVGVSKDVCKSFCTFFPEFVSKVLTVENTIPQKMVYQQSTEQVSDFLDDGSIRLLSVGRFCEAKNFDNVPEMCKIIRDSGHNVKWYLIGYGSYESLIREKIAEFGMKDYVIILGKKTNPYPYIARCDLYVQPSRFEGKAVTVLEAQILGRPVVITDYPTAKSQLIDGYDGIIVPMDNQGCAEGIVNILRDEILRKSLRDHCALNDYSNRNEVYKILKLSEG